MKILYIHLALAMVIVSCHTTVERTQEPLSGTEIKSTTSKVKDKTLLAIFAHPDDESTIAPLLHRYVREGVRVVLVIATDGRLGVNDFSGLEAGDGLAVIRREEMQCSADLLGVELKHLSYHDQLKCEGGYDEWMPHAQALIRDIHEIIEDVQPDVLITFGPDGSSNHMDHRLIGATVASVFLSRDWSDKPSDLYFYGTPAPMIENAEGQLLRGVAQKYMRTSVAYTEADFEAAFSSFSCHKSQVQLFGLRQRMKSRRPDNKIWLRKFVGPIEDEEGIF